jgi:hypothetical protein
MDVVNSMILISNLVLCISFVYLLVEKVENNEKVRIPYLSLGLLLLFVFLNFVTIITTPVNIAHKIFYLVSFISLSALLVLKIMNDTGSNVENFLTIERNYDEVVPNGSVL